MTETASAAVTHTHLCGCCFDLSLKKKKRKECVASFHYPCRKPWASSSSQHMQSCCLFFNLNTKSRSENSKDKVAAVSEAQSKATEWGPQGNLSCYPEVLLSSYSEVTLHFEAHETASETLNYIPRVPASHWILVS